MQSLTYQLSMITAGTIEGASSRLRCYYLADGLRQIGIDVRINERLHDSGILLVQKRINPNILAFATRFKSQGGMVIYDIDDYGVGLEWLNIDPSVERAFLSLCDVLIVDTPHRLEVFRKDAKYGAIPQKWVIPDPIDYYPWEKVQSPKKSSLKPSGIWFGNAINLTPAVPYLLGLLDSAVVDEIGAITTAGQIAQLQALYPGITYYPWQLASFSRDLQRFDFTVLVHGADEEGSQKSNNKMLAALAFDVLPFVSNTPAYAKTALDIGLPELIVESPQELVERIRSTDLLAQLKSQMGSKRHLEYMEQFHPRRTAQQFHEGILSLVSRPFF